MGLFNSIDVSATGLTLQRRKLDTVAENLANVETTRTDDGGPYRRKRVVVEEAKESIPFRAEMDQAQTKLYRTNRAHRPSSLRNSNNSLELSKVDSEEVQAPKDSFRLVHDPDHPDADEDGFVKMPDIEIVTEMVDMMAASRAYEANTMAIMTAKQMSSDALEI